jgi:FemAB-related protein (PEP-CTERM system-associated)
MIRPWRDDDAEHWDAYVSGHPSARCCHLSAWKRIIERTFGHGTCYLVSEKADGAIDGVLPIVRLRSRLFGDFLVSVPYLNYGGVCADDEQIARALMQAATGTAADLKVQHLEVRTETPTDYGLQVRSSKISMRLDLSEAPDLLWKRFPAKLRSQIKRSQQEAMVVRIGRADELDAFYEVFSVNMRDLGTPVYGKAFFASILRELPDSTWICVVYLGDKPVAAGFLMAFRGMLEIPWASSLRRYNRLSPNMLLYWSVLEFACQRGFRVFDFGRSSPDSGPFRFKAQWGAAPVPLYWHYWVRNGGPLPNLTPKNPRMQMAIRLWRRLPVAVTRFLGPPLVKNLP